MILPLSALIFSLPVVSMGAALEAVNRPAAPAPPRTAPAVPFRWSCEIYQRDGLKSKLEGVFPANKMGVPPQDIYLSAKAQITSDNAGFLKIEENVFKKSFSAKGYDGEYLILSNSEKYGNLRLTFDFYGYDTSGIVSIVEFARGYTPDQDSLPNQAIGVGYCYQFPLNAGT